MARHNVVSSARVPTASLATPKCHSGLHTLKRYVKPFPNPAHATNSAEYQQNKLYHKMPHFSMTIFTQTLNHKEEFTTSETLKIILQVVYIPVVDKEILWTKRCKDPALVGTVKEVIKQVSNSKKWASEKVMGEDGKERLVYSYSLLQDRYFEHMRAAGFTDFQRGERGSTTEHLDVLD